MQPTKAVKAADVKIAVAMGTHPHFLHAPEIEVEPGLEFSKFVNQDEITSFTLPVAATVTHEVPATPSLGRAREPHAPLLLPAGCVDKGVQVEFSPTSREARANFD